MKEQEYSSDGGYVERDYVSKHSHTPLMSALYDYANSSVVPFDVPGHKRGVGNIYLQQYFGASFVRYDVNSLPELDQLSHPEGVIKEAQDLLADAYKANNAFFMVNGTTSAVQTMILSVCGPSDKIFIPRNAHKSVINALLLSNALPIYLDCEFHDDFCISTVVSFETVKEAMKQHADAKAILFINPSYWGFCSELKEMIHYVKNAGLHCIVDEAHGSHLPFHDNFPKSAISMGADMAAISLHKSGGSLTQSSALLLNSASISAQTVQLFSNMLQSTSASYLLMASLDVARKNLVLHGKELFSNLLPQIKEFKRKINSLGGYYAYGMELEGKFGIAKVDETKIGIYVGGIGLTGFVVYELLQTKYQIQLELGDVTMILAIASIADNEESLNRLYEALVDIKKQYGKEQVLQNLYRPQLNNRMVLTPRDAFYSNKEPVSWHDAVNRIAAESVMAYPPGIPIVVPGERITKQTVEYIMYLKENNTHLTDCVDPTIKTITVVKEING